MEYSKARRHMMSGDVLMVKGRGVISSLIRALTGESISHVAMILRMPKGVFVVEMKEFIGWRMMPASQWMEKNKKKIVLWGKTPSHQRGAYCFESFAMLQRARKYSYWTLLTIWFSQITRLKAPNNLVCSTFVQKAWKNCGYDMGKQVADPGNFLEHAVDIVSIST